MLSRTFVAESEQLFEFGAVMEPKATATLEPETTQHNSLDRLQTRK